MTKEELDKLLLNWYPEIEFISTNGCHLIARIVAHNSHIIWDVRWVEEETGLTFSKGFDNFENARDYFLKQAHVTGRREL